MFLDNLRQDIRFALRSYAKAPSFAIAILATLALGIGASTAIFSMVNGIILRPLPFPEPDRLIFANELNPNGIGMSVSWPNFLDWRAWARSFDGLASSRNELLSVTTYLHSLVRAKLELTGVGYAWAPRWLEGLIG